MEEVRTLTAEKSTLSRVNTQLLQAQANFTTALEGVSIEARGAHNERDAIVKRFGELSADNKALLESVEILRSQRQTAQDSRVSLEAELRLARSSKAELEAMVSRLTTQREEAIIEIQRRKQSPSPVCCS